MIRNLLRAVMQLSWWRKLILGILLLIVVATWLGVCFILASYWPV